MNNLLSSNVIKIKRDKIFWSVVIALFLVVLGSMIITCVNVEKLPEDATFEDYYFNSSTYVSMFLAVFSSMFLGTEYSNGTIRNKMIIGKTRTSIYLSNFITNVVVSFVLIVVISTTALVGMPTLGFFDIGILNVIGNLMVLLFSMVSLSAIFTFVGMICSNRTYTLLISLLVLLVLIMAASKLDSMLKEPEMLASGITLITETGEYATEINPEPNPNYLTEDARNLVELAMEMVPTGPMIKVAYLEMENSVRMMLFSALSASVITFLGVRCFSKKDLK